MLCLHGYRQNAESSRAKLGALRKLLRKHVELVFITAPHEVPPLQDSTDSAPGFGWWFCSENRTFNAYTECDTSVGFEDSMTMLEKVFASQGPFHGVLGFSQGAAMAAMLASYSRAHPGVFDFNIGIPPIF